MVTLIEHLSQANPLIMKDILGYSFLRGIDQYRFYVVKKRGTIVDPAWSKIWEKVMKRAFNDRFKR